MIINVFFFYFTLLIMSGQKIEVRVILCYLRGKKSAGAVAKEIKDVKDPGTVNKHVA